MTAKRAPKKTIAQQRARIAERTPQAQLVPCGAVRVTLAGPVTCTLPTDHEGDHRADSRSWRRASGDSRP